MVGTSGYDRREGTMTTVGTECIMQAEGPWRQGAADANDENDGESEELIVLETRMGRVIGWIGRVGACGWSF